MVGEAIGEVVLEGGYVKDIDEDQRDIGASLGKGDPCQPGIPLATYFPL